MTARISPPALPGGITSSQPFGPIAYRPKASVAWTPDRHGRGLSSAQAGASRRRELYQIVTTPSLPCPIPILKPARARSRALSPSAAMSAPSFAIAVQRVVKKALHHAERPYQRLAATFCPECRTHARKRSGAGLQRRRRLPRRRSCRQNHLCRCGKPASRRVPSAVWSSCCSSVPHWTEHCVGTWRRSDRLALPRQLR